MTPILLATAICVAVTAPQDPGADSYRLELDEDAGLDLAAYWEPIADSTYGLHKKDPELFAFEPAEPEMFHPAAHFQGLLAAEPVKLGDVWKIEPAAVLPFLTQFHPLATTTLHHSNGVEGSFATLRAVSPKCAEVLVRIHFDVPLGRPGAFFSPAQLEGRLRIDRDSGWVEEFSLRLPPRNSNADINALQQADIVFVPRMELLGGDADEVKYAQEVPLDEAREKLGRSFYSFMAIDWLPLKEALKVTREQDRSLHVVVLFGSLDDESC